VVYLEPHDGSSTRCDLPTSKKIDRNHDIPYLAGYSLDGKYDCDDESRYATQVTLFLFGFHHTRSLMGSDLITTAVQAGSLPHRRCEIGGLVRVPEEHQID
jgi:hypothetical protein